MLTFTDIEPASGGARNLSTGIAATLDTAGDLRQCRIRCSRALQRGGEVEKQSDRALPGPVSPPDAVVGRSPTAELAEKTK